MSLTAIPQGAASAELRTLQTEAAAGLAALIGVEKRTVTITRAADLAGLANGVQSLTKALSGGALPANARFLGAVAHTLTGFSDGAGASYTIKVGATDDDCIIASLNVATGQSGFPKAGTLGVLGFAAAPLEAAVHNVILTSNADLNTASAGAITIDLFYFVLA